MADFGNMLGSDEDSNEDNEDIDHIPKTPGPAVISDREESDEEKSGDEEREEEEVKNRVNDSESDSDSSDSESVSSNENNRNSQNDSEVERSDNENDNRLINDANDGQSSDDNVDKSDNEEKAVNESHDNESDDEDVIRRRVSNKNKRKFNAREDSSSDESNESKSEKIQRKTLETSDKSDNEENDEEMDTTNAKAKDIFGDMSSEDEDDDSERPKDGINEDEDKHSDKDSSVDENINNEQRFDENSEDGIHNNEAVGEQSFIEEEEPPEEPVPETRIEVEIPRIVADLGKEIHFVKLPNFLSIDTHPYDPQWYEDEIDEDEIQDDEGRARLKLKVENTIRWKNVYDRETGETRKESNARTVRWSDGSLSLHLGDEIFDIHKLQLMPGDNNHLFIRQGTGLQGQTVFRTKLTFRPFSTESFTHRKLTLSLADRSQKTQKIRVLPNVGKDPEAHRSEMIKKEEDRLKASIRRENKQKRVRERSLIRGPTASYLEPDGDEDDEEEGISISKIKNQFKRGGSYSKYPEEDSGEESKQANDDDDSDLDIFDKKSDVKKKPAHIVESDDD